MICRGLFGYAPWSSASPTGARSVDTTLASLAAAGARVDGAASCSSSLGFATSSLEGIVVLDVASPEAAQQQSRDGGPFGDGAAKASPSALLPFGPPASSLGAVGREALREALARQVVGLRADSLP